MKKYLMFYQELDKKLNNIPSLIIALVLITITAIVVFNITEIKEGRAFIGFMLIWMASLIGLGLTWIIGTVVYLFGLWIKNDFLIAFRETQEEFEYTPKKKGKVEFN